MGSQFSCDSQYIRLYQISHFRSTLLHRTYAGFFNSPLPILLLLIFSFKEKSFVFHFLRICYVQTSFSVVNGIHSKMFFLRFSVDSVRYENRKVLKKEKRCLLRQMRRILGWNVCFLFVCLFWKCLNDSSLYLQIKDRHMYLWLPHKGNLCTIRNLTGTQQKGNLFHINCVLFTYMNVLVQET